MIGCDFCEGVKGVGAVKALGRMQAKKTLSAAIEGLKGVPEGWKE